MSYFNDIPDHPVIRNMERTGYPDGKEPEYPHCPVCGETEISEVYVKDYGIVGCDACITSVDAETAKDVLHSAEDDLCPECGRSCYTAYYDRDGGLVGCDECVSRKDAWEQDECFYNND